MLDRGLDSPSKLNAAAFTVILKEGSCIPLSKFPEILGFNCVFGNFLVVFWSEMVIMPFPLGAIMARKTPLQSFSLFSGFVDHMGKFHFETIAYETWPSAKLLAATGYQEYIDIPG